MTSTAIPQDDLVERLVRQEPLALEDFYRANRGRILAWTRQYVSDPSEAEDVLQDVLWTVHRKAHTFRGESGFQTWLYRVTQNAARMHLRKRKRVPAPVEDSVVEDVLHRTDAVAHPPRPDELVAARRAAERLQGRFAALPEENQALFVALEVRDEAREDVAERMGISVAAAKARLHRVRVALRSALPCPA